MKPRWAARALLIACAGATGATGAQPQKPLLLRDPSVGGTHIAFSYARNIWVARRDGSDLRRLTNGGHESRPAFSPDGSQIAFIGEFDGSRSVYVVSTAGGEPRRLTFHPADLGLTIIGTTGNMVGWSPDGKRVVFSSRRSAFANGVVQLFTVPAEGGFATQVPLVRAAQASFSPDGTRVAYVPNIQWQPEWKGYRGGQTTSIRIADLADSTIEATIPRDNSNDFNPMWVGDSIYFLSDRNGPVTLFVYDEQTATVREFVQNDGPDIKNAAASADAIVYEQFGSMHLLALNSGIDHVLDIRPQPDVSEIKPHFENVTDVVEGWSLFSKVESHISPTGARAVFGVRGEILTVPAEKGDIRNLTRTTDVVERDPAWSPDGQNIAYFSDESGEYALHIRDQGGAKPAMRIDLGVPPSFYYSPRWSPDSRKIAYTDKRLNFWYVELEKRTPVRIDTDLYAYPTLGAQLAWSPNSEWIAYTRQLKSHLRAVFIYSVRQARSYQLTDGISDALHVAFDPSGGFLYFTASTDAGLQTGWLDMTSFRRPVTRSVYAIVLDNSADTPFGPESDEEKPLNVEAHQEGKPGCSTAAPCRIDLEGIEERIVALPVPALNYQGLFAAGPGVVFLVEGPQVDDPFGFVFGDPVLQVHRFDTAARRTRKVLENVMAFEPSSNGERLLYARQGQDKAKQWFITPAEASAASGAESGRLALDSMQVYVDPRAEWNHMYEQVWRDQRDFFYDPRLHGLDLQALKKRYEPFLAKITSRDDLDYLFNEMLGNLKVSHMTAVAPAAFAPRKAKTGLLGADYTVQQGRYRFARIYRRDTWNPQSRAPLAEPGMSVKVGEYLLWANGRDVHASTDIYEYFQGTAGRHVVLRVGPSPDGTSAREITVVPIDDEASLRHFAWIEANRRTVDEMTGGRVAYIYLPNTRSEGFASFNRYFFAQVGKEAAIIDGRYNGGGVMADHVIDHLRRPLMSYIYTREGEPSTIPQQAIFGPKVMLINEMSGSGGDALPWLFRKAGVGPVVGTRTWGGMVGHYTRPNDPGDLMDGGFIATPDMAFFSSSASWEIENHGVSPDVEVEENPQAARKGHDMQLESAVKVVLDLLKKNPPAQTPRHPPFPSQPVIESQKRPDRNPRHRPRNRVRRG